MTAQIPLVGGNYYHIYNRGNNGETIFRTAENYRYFLQLFAQHIEPVATTFAFSLQPNHFHFLNYIRTDEEQRSWLLAQGGQGCQLSESWQPCPPSRAFKNLFIAYSMAFSIRYERTGSLFQKPFKRRLVDSDRYFAVLVRYIHRNPQKHGLISDFHHVAMVILRCNSGGRLRDANFSKVGISGISGTEANFPKVGFCERRMR